MVLLAGLNLDFGQWALALGFFIGSILLADIIIVAIDRLVRPLLARTKTKLDDFLFENLRGPLKLFFSIFGAYLGIEVVNPRFSVFGRNIQDLFFLAMILAVGHAAARALDAVMKWYILEIAATNSKGRVGDVFPLVRKLAKAAVYFATLVILLSKLGVEIGPLIAGLGVAGLAVALGLQDSMKNFFAGVYLLADKPIRAGDFIALDSDDSKIKGVVEEIGWRATRIRGTANAIHIIPNEKLAQSVIVNYSKGSDSKSVSVKVTVDYGSDVEKALDALKDAAQVTVKKSKLADPSATPEVRINEFLDSAIELLVSVRVKDYSDRFTLASLVRQNILVVFRKNKINIPYPVRTLNWKGAPLKPVSHRNAPDR